MNKAQKIEAIKGIDPNATGLGKLTSAKLSELLSQLQGNGAVAAEPQGTVNWQQISDDLMESFEVEGQAEKRQKSLVWLMMKDDLNIVQRGDVFDVTAPVEDYTYQDSRGQDQTVTRYKLPATAHLIKFHADLMGRRDELGPKVGDMKRNFNKRLRMLSKDKGIAKVQLHGSKTRDYYLEVIEDTRIDWEDMTDEQKTERSADNFAGALTDKVVGTLEFEEAVRTLFDKYAQAEGAVPCDLAASLIDIGSELLESTSDIAVAV